jgi:hydrogenase-1 operon protein HyaF
MNPDLAAPCQTTMKTGMAWSVLTEIHALLEGLAETGAPAAVDLRSLPLTTADRDELEQLLGRGELRCSLSLLGKTEVWETAFAGVWWVRHLGAEDRVSSESIEITLVPEILKAHTDDVRASERRLADRLDRGPGSDEQQEREETQHDA